VKCLHAHLAWYLAGGDDPVGRWVCTQLGIDPSTYLGEVDFHRPSSQLGGSAPVAAVDCGTNTTRLLVLGAGGQPLERLMRTTRLGQGVDAERKLTRAAMDRSLEALASFREVIDSHGVARVRAVATSAVRDARNGEEFLQRAGDVLGVVPEVINGEQEGRLTQLGVDSTLDPTGGPFTVIDVGGGSTELVGAHGSELRVASLDIGCVRVTERFLEHDPPLGSEMEAARAHVREVVSQAAQAEPGFADAVRLIGVAGTVSALVRYGLGLSAYDRSRIHHARLALDTVEQAIDELSATSLARRRQLLALESERADVILGGGLVLAEAMAALGFDALVASESDLLDGVASQLLQD
jgi:exopolyphosphatase/guanosine-5'-triphosphate,3'-diphosphate pyrophosphatase